MAQDYKQEDQLDTFTNTTMGSASPGWHECYAVVLISASSRDKIDAILKAAEEEYKSIEHDVRYQLMDEWSVPDAEQEQIFINYMIAAHKETIK